MATGRGREADTEQRKKKNQQRQKKERQRQRKRNEKSVHGSAVKNEEGEVATGGEGAAGGSLPNYWFWMGELKLDYEGDSGGGGDGRRQATPMNANFAGRRPERPAE